MLATHRSSAQNVRLFLLSDTHLTLGRDTTPRLFGDAWDGHVELMKRRWDATVSADDLVLMPGDIAWARSANEVRPDLEWLKERPGQRVISRGNHDRWWRSDARMREILDDRSRHVGPAWEPLGSGVVAGLKGMTPPGDRLFSKSAARKFPHAEAQLAELLEDLRSLRALPCPPEFSILLLHYPPCLHDGTSGPLQRMIADTGVDLCVYGHFHRDFEWKTSVNGPWNDTFFAFGAADALGFTPREIGSIGEEGLRLPRHLDPPDGTSTHAACAVPTTSPAPLPPAPVSQTTTSNQPTRCTE